MNRIFHARIAWYQYFLLVVLTVNAVGALWCKYILPAVLLMLLLIVVIEQIIHTVYTVSTDGVLEMCIRDRNLLVTYRSYMPNILDI